MKYLGTFLISLLPLASAPTQQNPVPQKQAIGYATECVAQTGTPADAQIAMEVDPKKAMAEQGEGGGAMVIPAKSLTKKKLASPNQITPVGQLWLRKWTLVVDGKPVPRKKLRMVTVNLDDKNRPLSLYYLGVRKSKKQNLELVVYAKTNKLLQTIPLKKLGILQDLPLLLEWQRGENQGDPLSLRILGDYEAVLRITRQGP